MAGEGAGERQVFRGGVEGQGLLFAARSSSRLPSLSDQGRPHALPSTLGSPPAPSPLVLIWLTITAGPRPKLGRTVGEKCVNSLLSSALPLYSQGPWVVKQGLGP